MKERGLLLGSDLGILQNPDLIDESLNNRPSVERLQIHR